MIRKLSTYFRNRRHWENKCFIGGPGTGKTVRLQELIGSTDFAHYLVFAERNELLSHKPNVEIIRDRAEFIELLKRNSIDYSKSIIIIDEAYQLIEDDYILLKYLLQQKNVKVWLSFQTLLQPHKILRNGLFDFLKHFNTFCFGRSLNGEILRDDFSEEIRNLKNFDFLEMTKSELFRRQKLS